MELADGSVATVNFESCNAVSIPTNITTLTGVGVSAPVNVDDLTGRGVLSTDFTVTYDSTKLTYSSVSLGTVDADGTVTVNSSTPGTLVVSVFSSSPFVGAGTLANLNFTAIGAPATSSALTFSGFVFNEGDPCVGTTNGLISILSGTISGTVSYGNPVGLPAASAARSGCNYGRYRIDTGFDQYGHQRDIFIERNGFGCL